MDWGEILTQVILGLIGLVITGLGTVITYLISTKIKDEKLKNILLNANQVVSDAVNYVYQTYVDGLKGTSAWNEEAMKTANEKAVEYIMNNLPADVKNYLDKNGKDIVEWIKEQIEIKVQETK